MTAEDVEWLVGEIQDVLCVGRVGLYEFIWILRSRQDGRSLEEMRSISQAALEKLRAVDDIILVQMMWPRFDVIRWPSWSELNDESWDDIGDGPYYAIVRPEELDEAPPESSRKGQDRDSDGSRL